MKNLYKAHIRVIFRHCCKSRDSFSVIPAKAGIQKDWMPVFTGMTIPGFVVFRHITAVSVFLGVLVFGISVSGMEMPAPIRQAEELYRMNRLADARTLAESVQKAFPKDLQVLLLLGLIEFDAGRFHESKRWFQSASAISPRHPLVLQYKTIFEEIEHRHGPISDSFLPLSDPDKTVTAERFKRGWFGPNFVYLYGKVATPAVSLPDSLGIRTHEMGVIEGASDDFDADHAIKNKWFLRAFLRYKDLMRNNPENAGYKIGAATAAIGMRRYREAREILNSVLAKDPENFRAKELLPQTEVTTYWKQ